MDSADRYFEFVSAIGTRRRAGEDAEELYVLKFPVRHKFKMLFCRGLSVLRGEPFSLLAERYISLRSESFDRLKLFTFDGSTFWRLGVQGTSSLLKTCLMY
jgi:hypothetical protein